MSEQQITVTYWPGRGRAEPLRSIIAAGGASFESVFLSSPEELDALKANGKVTYGQVPLVEVDGLNLVQGFPTAVYLGQKFGLWPKDAKDQYIAGQVFCAAQDARGSMLPFPWHQDRGRVADEANGEKGLFARYCAAWEVLLAATPGAYFLADASIADVAAFECLDFYAELMGAEQFEEKMAPYPKVQCMYNETKKLGRLAAWVDNEKPSLYLPYGDYSNAVNKTLRR